MIAAAGAAAAESGESRESGAASARASAAAAEAPRSRSLSRRSAAPAPAAGTVPAADTAAAAPRTRRAALPDRTLPAAKPLLALPNSAAATSAPVVKPVSSRPSATAVNPVQAFFFNQTPTLSPTQTGQSPTGVVTGNLNAVDHDSEPLAYTVLSTPAYGTVNVDSAGGYTYTPDPGLARQGITDTFSVQVSDAATGFHIHGLLGLINMLTFGLIGRNEHTSTSTVAVTVTPVNEIPTATLDLGAPDPLTGAVAGTVSGADADGDPLTYTAPDATAKGALILAADGTFTYTPTPVARHDAASLTAVPADLTDAFTVTVADPYGGAADVAVVVPISPANQAPTATATAGNPDASTGVVAGLVIGVDADGDPLSYTGPGATAKGAVLIGSGGAFTFTPTATARHDAASLAAAPGDLTDAFTITVADGHGGTIAVPVTVAIGPANQAPTATVSAGEPDPATGVVAGTMLGADADGDPLTYTGTATTAKGSVVVDADGGFTFTPTAAARHDAASLTAAPGDLAQTVTLTVADGYGGVTAVEVAVPIGPANQVPTATASASDPDPATGVVAGTVLGADADGDPLTYTAPATTAKGSVLVDADGGFTFTPTADARHDAASLTATAEDLADTVTITVADGYGGSVDVPVTVAISPANTAPVATATAGLPDPLTGVVAGTVLGVDADGDTLTYTGPTSTAKGAIVLGPDGAFTYTPTPAARYDAAFAADTADSFTVTVADGYGGSVDVPVAVAVSPASVAFDFAYGAGEQYWTPEARTALQTAGERLSSYLVVAQPVVITFSVIGENDPGAFFVASSYTTFTSGRPGIHQTVVQAEILTGVDVNGETADSQLTWNFAYPWAYGDTVPPRQYDFQSVAMHEMMHSLGILTGLNSPSSIGRNWTVYDSFLATADGTAVIGSDYVFDAAYVPNLTGDGGGLYFAGPNVVAVYGGPAPLYTPDPYAPGSSLVHLDPAGAPPGTTYLMDPSDGYGPSVRALTAVDAAILADLGYTVVPV